jgi:hypothetical protein
MPEGVVRVVNDRQVLSADTGCRRFGMNVAPDKAEPRRFRMGRDGGLHRFQATVGFAPLAVVDQEAFRRPSGSRAKRHLTGEIFSSFVIFTENEVIHMKESPEFSRRCLLKGVVLLAGTSLTASLGAKDALAQQKASKESMKYQDKPNADKQCSGCAQFVPPNGCKVVEGTISPQGYCIAWQKK